MAVPWSARGLQWLRKLGRVPVTGSVVATKLRIPSTPSMPLDRLDGRLDAVWRHRLAVVVAPAGSGKTTLLARLALRAPGPVGWYRAEGWDGDETTLLQHLEAALAPVLPGVPGEWLSVEQAANAIETWTGAPVLLIVDDLHTLQGTPAEAAIERLIDYAPNSLRFVIASRVPPDFNLPRLRVSGALLELAGDDLRFRSWEVERLFRDFYGEPLPPEELARLARRTEGWAAGLQLFHLATSGRPADERRRMLAALDGSTRYLREYLARNVVYQLPPELRRFLIDTSVLGRVSATLCDRLLDQLGSGELLADLERRRLFTQALPEEGAYRYHEVLRSYLQSELVAELGEDGIRARFRLAGELLAEAGAVAEALEAFCRAEDWEGARRLLDGRGEDVVARPNQWIDGLPPALVLHDPWLLLASARRRRAEGRLREAVEQYQRAETAFGVAETAALCHDERLALVTWLDGPTTARPDGFALLRSALRRDPGAIANSQAGELPTGGLLGGLAALLAGHASSARRELLHVAERRDTSPVLGVVASLAAGVAGLLMGQAHASLEVEGAVLAAEVAGLEWIARVGRATLALTGSFESVREANDVAVASAAVDDQWGAALAALCAAWGSLQARVDVPAGEALIARLRGLDVPVLEVWARTILALAGVRAGEPDARNDAVAAEAGARSMGVDAARMLAYLALSEAAYDAREAEEHRALALDIAAETGLRPPIDADHDAEKAVDAAEPPPVSVRVLGAFDLRLAGQPVDLGAVRPRARTLLRLLCLNAGRRVHHETIEAALWPTADSESSARNLHVAIAALRRLLEPAAGRGSFQLLRREGDAYLLAVPPGSEIDIVQFEAAVAAGRQAQLRGDTRAAVTMYQAALDLYRGELLAEDGPAEWVAERREAVRLKAVDASQALAEILLSQGEADRAAGACSVGLQIERYHDPLWRLLISARDQAGDQGAATQARLSYDRMLAELGVAPVATGNSPL